MRHNSFLATMPQHNRSQCLFATALTATLGTATRATATLFLKNNCAKDGFLFRKDCQGNLKKRLDTASYFDTIMVENRMFFYKLIKRRRV